MSKFISVLVKRPGQNPRHVNVSDKIESLQKNVGGYVEMVPVTRDMVILCDEEGRLKDKPYNCTIGGIDFVGDIIMCGRDADGFADLPVEWKDLKKLFPQLWKKAAKK